MPSAAVGPPRFFKVSSHRVNQDIFMLLSAKDANSSFQKDLAPDDDHTQYYRGAEGC